jgi:hypothetical protein
MGEKRDTAPEEVLDGDALIPRDIDIEESFSAEEVTPRVLVCPDCGHDQVDTGEHLRLPEDYAEGTVIVRCCGTTDPQGPRWCRTTFTATWPREGKRISFDRRRPTK